MKCGGAALFLHSLSIALARFPCLFFFFLQLSEGRPLMSNSLNEDTSRHIRAMRMSSLPLSYLLTMRKYLCLGGQCLFAA